ncbi:MAG: aminodeoxychorismate/anthranilate synthase component II [Gammaproteobacteria bacterium]|nr:aminodeoxychorismate/anthranilate synthase component II [Gammaproteobacteria bacterium]MCH9743297.1 aminodeoxychorismate/anthranilate synthase component II [Gammaproteobacteria bacterium]
MILLIDNYDSFVYNLARYVKELGHEARVVRNDKITIEQIKKDLQPTHIILSPGPCTPTEAGVSLAVVKAFAQQIPILGVCLGHQAIGQAFGANIVKALRPMHGKASLVWHDGKGLFAGLENPISIGRYHSLVIDPESLPDEFLITARSKEGEVMAMCHRHYPLYGVQFHPESILTQCGQHLLQQFLASALRPSALL